MVNRVIAKIGVTVGDGEVREVWSDRPPCNGADVNWTVCYFHIKAILNILMPFYDDMVSFRLVFLNP